MNLNILRPKDSEPDDRNTNPSEYIKIMNQKNIENRIIEPVLNNNIISNLKKLEKKIKNKISKKIIKKLIFKLFKN